MIYKLSVGKRAPNAARVSLNKLICSIDLSVGNIESLLIKMATSAPNGNAFVILETRLVSFKPFLIFDLVSCSKASIFVAVPPINVMGSNWSAKGIVTLKVAAIALFPDNSPLPSTFT